MPEQSVGRDRAMREARARWIVELLAQGDATAALNVVDVALQQWPDDPRLVMYRGIALGQVGWSEEGHRELKRATMLAPGDPEAVYNLAVQLYNNGDREEAAMAAREALRFDSRHGRALELLQKCYGDKAVVAFEAGDEEIQASQSDRQRGPDDCPTHMLRLGYQWTNVGKGLFAICLLSSLLLVIRPPWLWPFGLRRDELAVAGVFFWIFSGIASFFWMLMDIIDRNKRFVWLLPASFFGLVGLPAVPLGLYLYIGRKV